MTAGASEERPKDTLIHIKRAPISPLIERAEKSYHSGRPAGTPRVEAEGRKSEPPWHGWDAGRA